MKFTITHFAFYGDQTSEPGVEFGLDLGEFGETLIHMDQNDTWVYITEGVVDACNGAVNGSVERGNPNLINDVNDYKLVGSWRFLSDFNGSYYFTDEFEDTVYNAIDELNIWEQVNPILLSMWKAEK